MSAQIEIELKKSDVGIADQYGAMNHYATRNNVELNFKKFQDSVNPNLLRFGIQSLSNSPESYILIRSQFARSLSVFTVASYILGIGDRHLDNFLLDLSSGTLVGIDFGHAFGSATQILPVPELVPVRMTNQFTSFLKPLNVEGLLKNNMVHCMSALQQNKEVLMNTMDVFINEPLLDWLKISKRFAKDLGNKDYADPTFFPQQKIDIVEKKLSLHNPSYITMEELDKSIHVNKFYYPELKKVVLGEPPHIRSQTPEICSSVAQQIDCLIDQATDPNVLGRMYIGWSSFV